MPPALVRPYVSALANSQKLPAEHPFGASATTRSTSLPYHPRHLDPSPTAVTPALRARTVVRLHRKRRHPALTWAVMTLTLASTGLALMTGDGAATSPPDGGPVTAAQASRLQIAVIPAPALSGLAPAPPAAEPITQAATAPAGGAVIGPAGLCLDARASAVQLHRCTGSTTQLWTAPADGTLRTAGRCLQPAAYRLILVRCTGGPAQRWDATRGTLVARSLRQCLTGRGGEAYLAACTGGASQRWRLP
ncbi:ricin-type beta-trefoil lectin domain protein [Dactylosporangium aurantiacum]|uniref:Ricin-type beta-trefoil lectin domain protein n=1 Tax=Dactylosporangium aurantiacum TaxID=35754 RepID=A0A9Q9II88_9ACTN|nr:RICIN domain-containing protein [Dactylosporangium aurantiacum]MDG6107467.1 RICIN domain-containing protein [Dactylosporangium aurantiacum]UWZ54412.1 ricin-type beta-trefoil lectin domain protein [Dactylosporangium aurantiacum]